MTTHFRTDGGTAGAYLADQLDGNGQSINNLAFITSLASATWNCWPAAAQARSSS